MATRKGRRGPNDDVELSGGIKADVELLTDVFVQNKGRDEITIAKSLFDEFVEESEREETPKEKRARKGAEARAAKLTPEERSEIAKKAAKGRWKK